METKPSAVAVFWYERDGEVHVGSVPVCFYEGSYCLQVSIVRGAVREEAARITGGKEHRIIKISVLADIPPQ